MHEDKVIPLTHWIHGRLRIHFRNGHIAELEMSLDAAESLRKQIDNKQGAESIHGLHAHDGWVSAKGEEVVMTEWAPVIEYGWPNATADERAAMNALNMRRGVLHALAILWADRGRHDAGYSATAVATLHSLATREDVTRDQWDQLAVMAEGEEGVRLLADLKRQSRGKAHGRTRERSPRARPNASPAGDAGKRDGHVESPSDHDIEPSLSSEQLQDHAADDTAPDSAPLHDEKPQGGGTIDERGCDAEDEPGA